MRRRSSINYSSSSMMPTLRDTTADTIEESSYSQPTNTPVDSKGHCALSACNEPIIVVDASSTIEEEPEPNSPQPGTSNEWPTRDSVDLDTPQNPCLLSAVPWRDTRKHSLPTPPCSSGLTASQVRRLSERGEGAAKEVREATFLATLTQVNTPAPGGRRHSVVTISKVPQALFGRGRRESVAAFPSLSKGRRDSIVGCPPQTDYGSTHNLQLDIMDDIVSARKVRMKMWNTSQERVCEVEPVDETAATVRYTKPRRFSEYALKAPQQSPRRLSEVSRIMPNIKSGIVCSNADLQHLASNLTSSSADIDISREPKTLNKKSTYIRSKSFDSSTSNSLKEDKSWFVRRHQTLEDKKSVTKKKVSFVKDDSEIVWDKPSKSTVDANLLGSAIEVYLQKNQSIIAPKNMDEKRSDPNVGQATSSKCEGTKTNNNSKDDNTYNLSICSTLKDMFLK